MTGEKDLNILLNSMNPILDEEEYVFYPISDKNKNYKKLDPICQVVEDEGITLIITKAEAEQSGINYEYVFKDIDDLKF